MFFVKLFFVVSTSHVGLSGQWSKVGWQSLTTYQIELVHMWKVPGVDVKPVTQIIKVPAREFQDSRAGRCRFSIFNFFLLL